MSHSSRRIGECIVCNEDSRELYQCCPNEKDAFCQECWSKFISGIIQNTKVALLLKQELACDYCRQPIDYKRLPMNIQDRIRNILLTIPNSKQPKSIEEFHYFYNEAQELRHRLTNEKFVFLTQRHYNTLGNLIDLNIQSLMKSSPWNYREIWLPMKDEPTDDHHDQVNIFTSDDFQTNDNGCLILIQGSGVVRPGQWARSCCINDSLDIGSMFPYMAKAKEHNLSVIILNPNQTTYACEMAADANDEATAKEDEEGIVPDGKATAAPVEESSNNDEILSYYLSIEPLPRPPTEKILQLSTSYEHTLYVYDHIIAKCPAKKFYIVAHSAGGGCMMYLLRKRSEKILSVVTKIALTDSFVCVSPLDSNEIRSFLKANAIHFVASDEPMGTPIVHAYDFSRQSTCEEVSAGHPKHEYTSGCCVTGVFDFFFPKDSLSHQELDKTKF